MKFIVFGPGRCGSEMLVSILNQHPSVTCRSELLCDNPLNLPLWDDTTATGFKCLYTHVHPAYNTLAGSIFRDELIEDTEIRIVHLARRDKTAQGISEIVSNKLRKWHRQFGDDFELESTYIDPDELKNNIQFHLDNEAFFRSELAKHKWLEVFYEDLVEDFTIPEVWSFIGVDKGDFQPLTKKYVNKPLNELVTNWKELNGN